MKTYTAFLRWWLIFILMILGSITLYVTGMIDEINRADFTKISFFIYGLFIVFSIHTGILTYRSCKTGHINEGETGWFVADKLMALGMVGTVIGFIYTLQSVFVGLDTSSTEAMQGALSSMSTGMSTALYTTASGLICSLLLKVQLFNLSQGQKNSHEG
ncbi:hypothetical protein LCGC14_2748780 [marine sediment metagenome]|uniref:MotA/TolQ/ExbB proton channel domain-containing protein n=1 Tax=marine sediment metagenome TaxID=412755 RepID=A0A0F9BB59_9ZZZZ|nr:hypothetical protein [Desulfobacterales bacterium]